MTNDEACKWLANLRQDIGNPHYECLWGYEQAICEIMSMLEEQEYKTGYWENGHCTCCGEDIASKLDTRTNVQTFSFCPKCGAKMEVKWDEVDRC